MVNKKEKMKYNKIASIVLLILFVPLAIWSLGTGKIVIFFSSALITYILIKIKDKYLKN